MDRSAAEDTRQLSLFDAPGQRGTEPRRRIALAGRLVEFRFRRRRRRTIGLSINEQGLSVAAPSRAPWREIEDFIQSRARWIVAKLEQWAAAGRPPPLRGHSGERLPLHGAEVVLEVRGGRRAVALEGGERLVICLRNPGRSASVRELLRRWFRTRAAQVLEPRAVHYAAKLGLRAPPVAISNARAQWGVCMADGRIRLSWRLAHLANELADYVVAHEVAHLVELNHSKRFWRLIETLYPDWRAARRRIRLAAAALPHL